MVTGANSGIGMAAAQELTRMGGKVILVCRNRGRGEEARRGILAATGANDEDVSLMVADLSSLDSVRTLAKNFLSAERPLHVLVNNAGLILNKRNVTKDGLETTFEVNFLSHFLLTNLLLGALKSSAPSRIVNVTSNAHVRGHIDFDDLQEEKGYGTFKSYSQSKLAQVLFTYELARRLKGSGVTVNCVHPGVVASHWGRSSAGLLSLGLKLGSPFMLSPQEGADTVVYLASSDEAASVTGRYFVKRKPVASSRESMDESEAKRLWEISLSLSKLESSHI